MSVTPSRMRQPDSAAAPAMKSFCSGPTELFRGARVSTRDEADSPFSASLCLALRLAARFAVAQQYAPRRGASAAPRSRRGDPVPLDWVPPALAQLSAAGAVKNNFTLDRTMLGVAAGIVPDSDAPDAPGDQQARRRQRAHAALRRKPAFPMKARCRQFAPPTTCADGSTW